MTFKHLKFEDSPTMRSLERVAIEKGLISPQLIVKQASKKYDFSNSINLTENIVKLCDGLQLCGLDSKAEELSRNYLEYKKAQTLYETSKESGEDLVDSAHPQGSHKLEGVEGDCVIETIIDQHLQHLKMIDKKPTGKLSNSKSIINSAKIILAQESDTPDTLESLDAKIKGNLQSALRIINRIKALTDEELTIGLSIKSEYTNVITDPKVDNIKEAKSAFNHAVWSIKPGVVFGISEDTWAIVQGLVAQVNGYYDSAMTLRQKYNSIRAGQVTKGEAAPTSQSAERVGVTTTDVYGLEISIKNAIATLNGYKAAINTDNTLEVSDKNSALSWINNRLSLINNIKSTYESLEDESAKLAAAPKMLENLKKITSGFSKFYQGWIA